MSILDTKLCKKCGVEQHLSCFSKDKTHTDGLASTCKTCRAAYSKEYNAINKARIAKRGAEYRIKNKEQIAERRATHYARYKERVVAYHRRNKEKIAAQKALYRTKNREKVRTAQRVYLRKRRKEDVGTKLRHNISSRIHLVLKRPYKYATTAMLGCTKTELMNHLESMFDGEMTWENYGLGGWEVDHIKPLAKFDLTDEEQLKQACHYTNLQPLWAFDNRSKGAKYEETTNG